MEESLFWTTTQH